MLPYLEGFLTRLVEQESYTKNDNEYSIKVISTLEK
jgi:hypothetical protein